MTINVNQIKKIVTIYGQTNSKYIWRPPSQSALTPIIFNMGLSHLGLEVFNYCIITG